MKRMQHKQKGKPKKSAFDAVSISKASFKVINAEPIIRNSLYNLIRNLAGEYDMPEEFIKTSSFSGNSIVSPFEVNFFCFKCINNTRKDCENCGKQLFWANEYSFKKNNKIKN